jgi:GT2 family glycosyltransferase
MARLVALARMKGCAVTTLGGPHVLAQTSCRRATAGTEACRPWTSATSGCGQVRPRAPSLFLCWRLKRPTCQMYGCNNPVVLATTAIMVNYNSGHDSARLLRQLAAQRGVKLDVIVIDSASTDESMRVARKTASEISLPVRFIEPGRNVGYTGNNIGLKIVSGDAFVVNPDVELLDEDVLLKLSRHLQNHPDLAAVAPHIRVAGGIEYTDSVLDLANASAFHPAPTSAGWPHPDPVAVLPWVNGAAWLLRREALDQVGLLDERFFLFCEEVDWCIRARRHGWRVGLVGDASVIHRRSSSFSGTKGGYYYWRNVYLLCAKHPEPGWRRSYHRRLISEGFSLRQLARGGARRAAQGYIAARFGHYGAARDDR